MSGTAKGGVKLRETMIKKYGSEEAWKEIMRQKASKGGKNSNNGGFASKKRDSDGLSGADRASIYGAVGGRISRRTSKKPVYVPTKDNVVAKNSRTNEEILKAGAIIEEKRHPITNILRRFV